MNDAAYAARLAATYDCAVTALRPRFGGGEEIVCQAAPCALSRTAQVSAPAPPPQSGPLPESSYKLTLYTRPELWFRLGDRLEVADCRGRTCRGTASDSFCYPTHCVTVLDLLEIDGPAAAPGGETQ